MAEQKSGSKDKDLYRSKSRKWVIGSIIAVIIILILLLVFNDESVVVEEEQEIEETGVGFNYLEEGYRIYKF